MGYAIHYSDLVLVGILASLVAGGALGYLLPLETTVTVPVMAVGGMVLIYHSIFINGPVDGVDDLDQKAQEVDLFEP